MVKSGEDATPASRGDVARDRLAQAALIHFVDAGSTDGSLRSVAAALGVSHSLLLYHFGSMSGLLVAVHLACEQRQREHLGTLSSPSDHPVAVMRAMWRHLAEPEMWPVYRLGFLLRARDDVPVTDQNAVREEWAVALRPILRRLDVPRRRIGEETELWVATCRGLLWELVTGAEPKLVDKAAQRFIGRYRVR